MSDHPAIPPARRSVGAQPPGGGPRSGPIAPYGDRTSAVTELRTIVQRTARLWRSMVVIVVLIVAAAAAYTMTQTPVYQTTTTFFVASSVGDGTNALQADQYAQQRINSYVGVLKSERLAKLVINDTGLDLTPDEVAAMVYPSADPDTVLLTVDVRGTSPQQTEQISDSIADTLDDLIGQLDNRGSTGVRLRVIGGPTLQPDPIAPRRTLNLAIGLLLGAAVAVGQALLRTQLDTTFRSSDELSGHARYSTLATLNDDPKAKKAPVLIADKGHSRRAEIFRQLRTNLRFADVARHVEVLVVTSSTEAEGKSTVSANLAISFAESGRSVLLVDADLRKPRLDRYLDVEGGAGVTSILLGDAEPAQVIQRWAVPGLSVLTSGPIPPNPSEMLGSPSMEKLLAELRSDFDLIIIDSPPLLPVTDAAVVATMADGVLLVVRHGSTRREQLDRSLSMLEGVDARILGTVLTFAPNARRDRLPDYYLNAPG